MMNFLNIFDYYIQNSFENIDGYLTTYCCKYNKIDNHNDKSYDCTLFTFPQQIYIFNNVYIDSYYQNNLYGFRYTFLNV